MAIRIPIRLLNIEGDGYHLQFRIRINGKSANVILDTGASKTVFDKERIAAFLKKEVITENERLSTGLGTASMQSHVVTLRKISIGTLDILEYNGVVLDLGHVNQTYTTIGLKPIDGVVGSDLLEKFSAIIDYGKKELILKSPRVKKAAKKKLAARKKSARKK